MFVVTVLLLLAVALPVLAGGQSEEAEQAEPQETQSEGSEQAADLERTPQDPRLYEPGKLTVATSEPAYPPWMLNDDPASGEGFENGLVYELAAEMGFDREDVQWVRVTFDEGIAPGPKNFDFNIQQYSVTEKRAEVVDFSRVYYQPRKAVIALEDSPVNDAESFAELREANWGAMIGSTDLDYLENRIGVDNAAVYDDQVGVFQAMQAGQIDGTLQSLPTALYVTAVQVPDARIAALLPADPNDKGHGLVFEKGNPIVPWVNDALTAVIERGVVDRLAEEYLVGDADITEISE
jgi:polar amino acid transport system substrate-binding protein